jgi:hypothetical protein
LLRAFSVPYQERAETPLAPGNRDWSRSGSSGKQREIEQDAHNRADRQKQGAKAKGQSGDEFYFVGVIYARAAAVRAWGPMRANVIFVPDELDHPHPDAAHAIIVAIDLSPDEIRNSGQVLDFLQESFTVD